MTPPRACSSCASPWSDCVRAPTCFSRRATRDWAAFTSGCSSVYRARNAASSARRPAPDAGSSAAAAPAADDRPRSTSITRSRAERRLSLTDCCSSCSRCRMAGWRLSARAAGPCATPCTAAAPSPSPPASGAPGQLRLDELPGDLDLRLARLAALLDEQRRQARGRPRAILVAVRVLEREGVVALDVDGDGLPHALDDGGERGAPPALRVRVELVQDALQPRAAEDLLADRPQARPPAVASRVPSFMNDWGTLSDSTRMSGRGVGLGDGQAEPHGQQRDDHERDHHVPRAPQRDLQVLEDGRTVGGRLVHGVLEPLRIGERNVGGVAQGRRLRPVVDRRCTYAAVRLRSRSAEPQAASALASNTNVGSKTSSPAAAVVGEHGGPVVTLPAGSDGDDALADPARAQRLAHGVRVARGQAPVPPLNDALATANGAHSSAVTSVSQVGRATRQAEREARPAGPAHPMQRVGGLGARSEHAALVHVDQIEAARRAQLARSAPSASSDPSGRSSSGSSHYRTAR